MSKQVGYPFKKKLFFSDFGNAVSTGWVSSTGRILLRTGQQRGPPRG